MDGIKVLLENIDSRYQYSYMQAVSALGSFSKLGLHYIQYTITHTRTVHTSVPKLERQPVLGTALSSGPPFHLMLTGETPKMCGRGNDCTSFLLRTSNDFSVCLSVLWCKKEKVWGTSSELRAGVWPLTYCDIGFDCRQKHGCIII